MSTFASTAEPIIGRSKMTRILAMLIGFAVLCLGLVTGGAQPAFAAGQTVSGKIVFPASAPSNVRQALDPNATPETRVGVYLTLYYEVGTSLEGWQLGEDGNVSYNPATGDWSVAGVPSGDYRLTISSILPNNGYAAGTFQEFTVNNADVEIEDTVISESGRLRASLGLCGWQQGDESKQFVKNVDTNNTYQLEAAQSGWGEPSTVCPPEINFGNYSLSSSGIPAGNYIAFSEWNGNTGYYVGEKLPASPNANAAVEFNVQNWVGTWVTTLMRPTVTAGELTVSGTAKVGQSLTAEPSGWTTGAAFEYEWLRGGQPISGATAQTYGLTASDVDAQISVRVTGKLDGYEDKTVASAAKTVASAEFVTSPVPTISGTPQVGKSLTAQPGTWAPAVDGFDYQWLRGNASIDGATGEMYALIPEDVDKQISVRVTGTKAGYTPKPVPSEAKTIAAAEFESTPASTISGIAKVGETLTAVTNEWTPASSDTSYQWMRDGELISGATAIEYVLAAADEKHGISVQVTGAKAGYESKLVESDTVTVGKGAFTSTPMPTVSGTAKVGNSLTAKAGTWKPSADKYTYQWFRDGNVIAGANQQIYVPSATDAGKQFSVEVTGEKAGYTPVSKTSAKSAKVVKAEYVAPAKTPFKDVPEDYRFYEPIAWMFTEGLSTGVKTSNGRDYQPKVGVSREAMAAFLYRLEGASYQGPSKSPFADIEKDDKFYNEMAWMHETGLSTGVKQASGKPNYAPKAKVSREAMAAFIYRLEEATTKAPKVSPFGDMHSDDKFYKEISWMSTEGLSTGIKQQSGKPFYAPKASVSREAMAAFLYRLETR